MRVEHHSGKFGFQAAVEWSAILFRFEKETAAEKNQIPISSFGFRFSRAAQAPQSVGALAGCLQALAVFPSVGSRFSLWFFKAAIAAWLSASFLLLPLPRPSSAPR